MWAPTISSDELYHHGILNMKWGVRNGPPYPLQPGQHSAAEKKAMGKKSKTNTDPGKAATKRKFNLSEDQKETAKKVAKGAAIAAGTVIAAYAAYKYGDFIKSKAYNKIAAEAALNRAMMNMGGTPSQRGYHMSYYGDKATKLENKAKEVSKSVIKSAKYLNETKKAADTVKKASNVTKIPTGASRTVHNVKKTATTTAKAATETAKKVSNTAKSTSSGINLEFGGPSSTTSSSSKEMETILKAAKILNDAANASKKESNKSTGQKSYTESLLGKNGDKLRNMTIDDLKRLDLY